MGLDDLAQTRLLKFLAKLLGYLLLLLLTFWVGYQIRGILPPFFIAFVFAVSLAPIVDRMEARNIPRGVGAALAFLLVFGTIGSMLFVLVPLVSDQIGQIATDLRTKFNLDQPTDISKTLAEQIRIFGRNNAVPAFVLQPMVHQAKNSATLLTGWLQSFGQSLLAFIPNLILVILVPIIALYAVIDYHRIFAKMLMLFPRHKRDDVRGIAADMALVFGRYLRGLGIVCLLDTVATTLVLLLFPPTRPYAAALGLIAGLLYAVPYLGAIVSTSLVALVALVSPAGGSFGQMLWVTLAMVLLHQVIFDQVISPRVLGGQVGLHPILSIFALMAGDALFGIAGMLLAVPIAASIQVIVIHVLPRLARTIEVKPASAESKATEPKALPDTPGPSPADPTLTKGEPEGVAAITGNG